MLVTTTLGAKLNYKGKSPLVATTCEWKHTTYTQCNNPVRYICTSGHSNLRSIQLQERIHNDHVTGLQKVKLHLRGRRAIPWRIKNRDEQIQIFMTLDSAPAPRFKTPALAPTPKNFETSNSDSCWYYENFQVTHIKKINHYFSSWGKIWFVDILPLIEHNWLKWSRD